MPKFKPGDIVKGGDYYREIISVLENGCITTDPWSYPEQLKVQEGFETEFSRTSATADWQIIERGGKPYEPEKWMPEKGERYWYVNFGCKANVLDFIFNDDETDCKYFDKGLAFRTEEEALACAERMLKAAKSV